MTSHAKATKAKILESRTRIERKIGNTWSKRKRERETRKCEPIKVSEIWRGKIVVDVAVGTVDDQEMQKEKEVKQEEQMMVVIRVKWLRERERDGCWTVDL